MNDPTIVCYNQPRFTSNRSLNLAVINLDEHRWTVGVYVTTSDNQFTPIVLQAEIGRIVSVQRVKDQSRGQFEISYIPTVNCTDLFTDVNMNRTQRSSLAGQ